MNCVDRWTLTPLVAQIPSASMTSFSWIGLDLPSILHPDNMSTTSCSQLGNLKDFERLEESIEMG